MGHLLAHLLQIIVKLIHWIGQQWISNHFSQVRNKHTIFKQRVLKLLSESGQNKACLPHFTTESRNTSHS